MTPRSAHALLTMATKSAPLDFRTTANDRWDLRPVSATLQRGVPHAAHPRGCTLLPVNLQHPPPHVRASIKQNAASLIRKGSKNATFPPNNQTPIRTAANNQTPNTEPFPVVSPSPVHGRGGQGVRPTPVAGRGRAWRRCCAGSRSSRPRSCSRPSAGTGTAGGPSAAPTCCCRPTGRTGQGA